MKYLKQFGIILILSFVGETLNYLIPLPIPGSIYGLMLMLFCLRTGIFPISAVRETGIFLIEIMPIMFIPAAVGLLKIGNILKPIWLPFTIVTVVSTILVMGISGRMTQFVLHIQERGNHE